MGRQLGLATRRWRSLPLFAVLVVGARVLGKVAGLPDPAGLLILVSLVGAWACVGFIRSEHRREREDRGRDGS